MGPQEDPPDPGGAPENMAEPPAGQNGPSAASNGPAAKKTMADMSKEELMAKCKGLLQIAQKAKLAKDGK